MPEFARFELNIFFYKNHTNSDVPIQDDKVVNSIFIELFCNMCISILKNLWPDQFFQLLARIL